MTDALIYVLRPAGHDRTGNPVGTSLWLPQDVVAALGLKRGDMLSADQFASPAVQGVIEGRKGGKSP